MFELVKQLEEAFYEIGIGELFEGVFADPSVTVDNSYFFKGPSAFSKDPWVRDPVRIKIIKECSPIEFKSVARGDHFFGRFAFYSGRLGFREYDFSATAAIQVLGNARTLKWNVINYTHEIIHNHVRALVDSLLTIGGKIEISKAVGKGLEKITDLSEGKEIKQTYAEYFMHVVLMYCINTEYYGGLSQIWNTDKYNEQVFDPVLSQRLCLHLYFPESIYSRICHQCFQQKENKTYFSGCIFLQENRVYPVRIFH